jgi:hypothetical protein
MKTIPRLLLLLANFAVSGVLQNSIAVAQSSGPTNDLNGLVLWWTFDENTGTTANDLSGSGYNGTLNNGPTWVTGQITNALSLNGSSSQYVGVSGPAGVMGGLTGATLCAWVQTTSQFILGFNDATGNRFSIVGEGGVVYFCAENGSLSYPSCSYTPDGNWHWFALSYNGSASGLSSVTGYIDGVALTLSAGGSNPGSTLSSTLGTFTVARDLAYSAYHTMNCDDVRLYNRALSVGEITNQYQWPSGARSTPSAAQLARGRTYYIDYGAGSDSNNGLSTNAPWKHDPYMAGFTGSYTHIAGEQHIFKGGVTWPYSCFCLSITAGGTSSAQDYYGTNGNWYAGSAWSPPIWDCEMPGASSSGGALNTMQNHMVITYNANNVTFDSIVMTNLNWSGTGTIQSGINLYVSSGIVLTNMQFLCYSNLTGGSGSDTLNVIYGAGAAGALGNQVTHCTFTCSPNTQWSGQAVYGGTDVDNCTFSNMPNFIVGPFTTVAYNFLTACQQSIDPAQHENIIELFGNNSFYVHHNIESNNISGECMIVCPGTGVPSYIWDNLIVANNTSTPAILADGQISGGASTGTLNIWNNTFQDAGGNSWVRVIQNNGGSQWAIINCSNNFFITGNTKGAVQPDPGVTTAINQANNLVLMNATAISDGYAMANSYQAPSTGGPTVSAGGNLTSFMAGIGLTAVDFFGNPFPGSGSWDIGAYHYAGGGPAAWNANLHIEPAIP